jgi:hypothetical protein
VILSAVKDTDYFVRRNAEVDHVVLDTETAKPGPHVIARFADEGMPSQHLAADSHEMSSHSLGRHRVVPADMRGDAANILEGGGSDP